MDGEVDKLRRAQVFMAQITGDDYFNWRMRNLNQEKHLELAEPAPTAEQFWNAAYEFSLHSTPAGTVTKQAIRVCASGKTLWDD